MEDVARGKSYRLTRYGKEVALIMPFDDSERKKRIRTDPMYDELVSGLLFFLREQTEKIVLYGSVARGTDEPDSDIDIALFLTHPLDTEQKEHLTDLEVELDLKYNKVFSIIDIDLQGYLKWREASPFYQAIDRDGIVLHDRSIKEMHK